MLEIVGRAPPGIVIAKPELAVAPPPSRTVTVITAVPVRPVAGVMLTVRLLPVPPKTMFADGTSNASEEVPLTRRVEAAVSASPIVNGIGPVDVLAVIN